MSSSCARGTADRAQPLGALYRRRRALHGWPLDRFGKHRLAGRGEDRRSERSPRMADRLSVSIHRFVAQWGSPDLLVEFIELCCSKLRKYILAGLVSLL